ncbi:MAG: hypothetical protein JXK93_07150 [Sphaerochaetaceae bacterium]|nr:hypothetical protein [Sphaerochaetaceae bacterium]
MADLLPMILSVGLFFLTLIIIITLRNSDRNEHRLEHVKRYVGGHLDMLKNKDNELLAHISEYESRFIEAQNQAVATIAEIEKKREMLFAHVNELIELESTVVHYHEVLTNLSTLTLNAEQRISYVQEKVDHLKEVEQLIESYREAVSESEENLDRIEGDVHQRVSLFEQRVDSYAAGLLGDTEEQLEAQRQEFVRTMDPLLSRVRSLIIPLFDQITSHVDSLTDRQRGFAQSVMISLDEASRRITEMKEEEHHILEEVDELSKRKSSLAQDLEHLQGELYDKGRELEETSKRVDSEREELAAVESDVIKSREELNTISSQVSRTRDDLEIISQEMLEGNNSLKTIDDRLEQMNEQNLLAEREKARIEEDLETSRESLDDLTRSIEASSQVNQQLLDEKARIEQDIEEALQLQKEIREREEMLSMRERERIDYPDFEEDAMSVEEEERPSEQQADLDPEVFERPAEDTSTPLLFKDEQKPSSDSANSLSKPRKHRNSYVETEEGEDEEVVVTFDDEDERV